MKDILFLFSLIVGGYVFIRVMLKEPIIPWKDKKVKTDTKVVNTKKKKKKNENEIENILDEEEAVPFKELFPDVVGFEDHMIRRINNSFSLMVEVIPVNYFLLDSREQETVDGNYETWLAQIPNTRQYFQSRFIDLTEQIEEIQRVQDEQDDLNIEAREYGQNMMRNLKMWQESQPRFEVKRFIIFDYQVEVKDIVADSDEELEEKILRKAFAELNRRFLAAKSRLKRANMELYMLTTEGITEVCYYTFNRRKALKNRFRDIADKEQLALYVTADQSPEHVAFVKGEIEKDVQPA